MARPNPLSSSRIWLSRGLFRHALSFPLHRCMGENGVTLSVETSKVRLTGKAERLAEFGRRLDPVAVAVLAVAVSAAGASRPSLWRDEAATISASTRPLPELWELLANRDAVHGLYYLIMHGWFALFPATEFWSRLSSSLTVGLAAVGVVVLGKQLSTRAVAVTSGILFTILPRTTWVGIDARPYALSMVAGVWLTVLCVVAARRNRAWLWAAYSLSLIAATVLAAYILLIIAAHAAVVAAMSGSRRTMSGWAVAVSVAAAMVTPFLLFTQTQTAQVEWIPPVSASTVAEIAQQQYFDNAYALAFTALTVAVVIAAARRWRRVGVMADSPRWLVIIATLWMAAPTATLLLYSVVRQPIYNPRYLSFTAPAIALLIGLCVVAVGRSRARIALLLVLFTAAAAPSYLMQRGPYAKSGDDYSQVADVITYHAAPRDCLIADDAVPRIRHLLAARPAAYEKLHDYGRGRSAIDSNQLFDSRVSIGDSDKLRACPALWTISERDKPLSQVARDLLGFRLMFEPSDITARSDYEHGHSLHPGHRFASTPAYQVPSRLGFHVVERWQFSRVQVTKSAR
jgi:mannosyltransferase